MQLDKWKLTVMALVGAAFTIFGVWQINVPLSEQLVGQVVDIVFVILGTILGVASANLTPKQ